MERAGEDTCERIRGGALMRGMALLSLGGLLGRERYSHKDAPLPALAFTQTRELRNEPLLPPHLRHLIWWWCWGGGGEARRRREALARSLRSSPSESASFPRHVPRRKRGGSGGAGSRSPSHTHTESGAGVCVSVGGALRVAMPRGRRPLGWGRAEMRGWGLDAPFERRMRAPSAP